MKGLPMFKGKKRPITGGTGGLKPAYQFKKGLQKQAKVNKKGKKKSKGKGGKSQGRGYCRGLTGSGKPD